MSLRGKQFYEFGPFRLDPDERVLLRGDEPVTLPPKVFDTLLVFVRHSGHVVTKEELMRELWPDSFVEESNLTQNVFLLRRALDGAGGQRYIETLPKRGYRFSAGVREVRAGPVELVVERHTRTHIIAEEEESGLEPEPPAAEPSKGNRFSEAKAWRKWARPATVALLVVAVTMLAGLAGLTFRLREQGGGAKPPAGPPVRSIAVLPFRPIAAEPHDEYLELGMADALITKLSSVRQVTVRPTSAVLKYMGREADALAVGRELRVDAVLTGTVQRAGDELRVTVQLVGVREGGPLWAETFDEKFTNIFDLQDRVSAQVARAIAPTLTGAERRSLSKRYTASPEAYQAYIRGRYFWNKRTADGFRKAVEYFEQAVAADPNYALAYAGLADSYALLSTYDVLPTHEVRPKVKAAAERALELDDTLAEAHTSLAPVKQYEWDWAGEERALRRAIEINPGYATAHHWLSNFLLDMGRYDEAIAEIKRAQEIDPLSLPINTDVGATYLFARRYEEALAHLEKGLELDPNYAWVHHQIGYTYFLQHRDAEAVAKFLRAMELSGESPEKIAALKRAYERGGMRGYWRKQLELAKGQVRQGKPVTTWVAEVYGYLGDREQALSWLEKAYEERDDGLCSLKIWPSWDALRSDPRFIELERNVGLTP